MKYPFEKQKDLKDCGICCLKMITRYFGGCISKEYLRDITNTTREGVTAFDLIEGAKKLGFNAYGVNGDVLDIDNSKLPCIAHVVLKKSYYHFIVIYKINKKKKELLIADPSNNHISKIKLDDFKNISTNNYIFLKPMKKLLYVDKNTKLKDILTDFIFNNIKTIFKILILSIIITLTHIFLSFEFKILLEYVINYHNTNNLIFLSLIFLLLILIKELNDFRRNNLVNKLNHNLDKHLVINVYNHILSLPYPYYKNRTTGEIVSRINDLITIRNVISKFIVTCFIDLLLIFSSFIILFILDTNLALITLITLILVSFLIIGFNGLLNNYILKVKKSGSIVNSYLVETISGIETIKNQNITDFIKKKFLLKYSRYGKESYNQNHLFIILEFIKELILSISNLIILIVGSYLIVNDKLDLAILLTFITLTNYIFSPLNNLIDLMLSLNEAKVSFDRIHELYEVEEEKTKSVRKKMIKGNIDIKNLSYSYNSYAPFLKNINLSIKPGEKILVYGKSGSGKSTLAKILIGNLKVMNKQVMIDNKDINTYSLYDLRKNICYVSNNETIFTDTVWNNIQLDKEDDTSFDEVTNICMVDEFIEKNDLAYNLYLEENGFNLSGGQKQRIILARSLLNNANIYIFDESLNQVDITRERKILTNIFNKYRDKTFIYISHRFNNSDLFDKKYKIEDGVCYEDAI